MGIHPENEFDSLLIPAVQFCGQGEVGVPAQGDLPGMRGDQLDRPFDPGHAAFVANHVAGTVDQIEHLVGVGERDHQGGIAPNAFVGKSHAAFAFPESRRNGAIGIDKGLSQKAPGLLIPNPLPHRVGDLHELEDIGLFKATGEVSTGGRVGNALGAQTIEEGLIIASQFNILQPHSIQQRVVGQIQHMIALMVRKVLLKQMQPGVDLLPQPQFVDHQMDRADASAVNRPGFLGHLVVNVAGLQDRLRLVAPTALGVQTASNSALAITQDLRIASLHSK
jgi:hypothetical protein